MMRVLFYWIDHRVYRQFLLQSCVGLTIVILLSELSGEEHDEGIGRFDHYLLASGYCDWRRADAASILIGKVGWIDICIVDSDRADVGSGKGS